MMFARITRYKMKAGSRDEAMVLLEQLKGQILALDGLEQFINCMNEDGSGCVISLVESEEKSNANAESVQAIWGQFADYLEMMPTPEGFDVIANWRP